MLTPSPVCQRARAWCVGMHGVAGVVSQHPRTAHVPCSRTRHVCVVALTITQVADIAVSSPGMVLIALAARCDLMARAACACCVSCHVVGRRGPARHALHPRDNRDMPRLLAAARHCGLRLGDGLCVCARLCAAAHGGAWPADTPRRPLPTTAPCHRHGHVPGALSARGLSYRVRSHEMQRSARSSPRQPATVHEPVRVPPPTCGSLRQRAAACNDCLRLRGLV